jgi:hypothetical protein
MSAGAKHFPLQKVNQTIPLLFLAMKKLFLFAFLFSATCALHAQNWTPMAVGMLPDNVVIFSISAVGEDVVWAIASEEYYQAPIPSSHRPLVLRTSDGGLSWSVAEVAEAGGTISFQIVAEDSLTAWITTQDYGSGAGRALYKTTDGGINWIKKLADDNGGVALYRFADGQHWLAQNRQGLSISANNGANWMSSTLNGYNSGEFQLLHSGANMSNTVGDTVWSGTSGGRVIRISNYGQKAEFFSTPLGTATAINSVAFQDHLNGLCSSRNLSNNNRIARSTDGGATWAALAKQPGNTTGWNIAAVPGTPGFYVLASNYNFSQGKVAVTTNFGESWTLEDLGQSLNAVVFTSPTSGWIGGGRIASSETQPALFKYTGSPLVGSKEILPALPGFSVSPNPAGDVVHFNFDGFTGQENMTATMTDFAGRIVFLGNISGNKLDISALDSGIYFLKIETEGKAGWAKLMKK